MPRPALALFAALAPLAVLGSTAAFAQGAAPYRVTLAAAPAEGRVVVRDVLWSCAGGTCTGGRSASRPAIVCQSVARQFGPVTGFTAAGLAFDAGQLERCNASAPR